MGGGRSGTRCKIKRMGQVLNWVVVFKTVDENNMGSGGSITGYVNKFIPNSKSTFPDKERHAAWEAFDSSTPPTNYRYFYRVLFKKKQGNTVVYVFTGVPDTNKCPHTAEIEKIGTPTSKLPNATSVKTISARLQKYNITKSGTWGTNEWEAVLAGLNTLTNQELSLIKDSRTMNIVKKSSPSKTLSSVSNQQDEGGLYDQASHTIEILNSILKNGKEMTLGDNPTKLLPGVAHVSLHEAAHALAYVDIRKAQAQEKKALADFKTERNKMLRNWASNYTETSNDPIPAYKYNNPRDRTTRKRFLADLKAYENARKKAVSAVKNREKKEKNQSSKAVSLFMRSVKKGGRSRAHLTPYTKKVFAKAGSKVLKRAAMEEFFAESFAIYHWHPDWLKNHRRPIYDFFKANKHC